MFIIVGSLILGALWVAGKGHTLKAAEVETLPPPDAVAYSPGRALISPAMSGGSRMMAHSNLLRLTTQMQNVQQGGPVAYRPRGIASTTMASVLPTPQNGPPLPTAAPLPTVEQGEAPNILRSAHVYTRL